MIHWPLCRRISPASPFVLPLSVPKVPPFSVAAFWGRSDPARRCRFAGFNRGFLDGFQIRKVDFRQIDLGSGVSISIIHRRFSISFCSSCSPSSGAGGEIGMADSTIAGSSANPAMIGSSSMGARSQNESSPSQRLRMSGFLSTSTENRDSCGFLPQRFAAEESIARPLP